MRAYDQHRQVLDGMQNPQEVMDYINGLLESDPDLYEALLLRASDGSW